MGDRLICAHCGAEAVNGACPTCPARDSLTTERLARLRTWATRHRPPDCGPDIGRHLYDGGCPWCRSDDVLKHEVIDGYQFDGNAHDVALELLDEIQRLRTEDVRLRAIAYRALGREVTDDDDGLVECWSCTVDRYAGTGPCYHCGAAAERPAVATVSAGNMAVELPGIEPDKVVDLMEALERSVADARAAWKRYPQPARGEDG